MDTINKVDKIFNKPLAVNIYEGGSSLSRKQKLLISVEWSSATSGNHRRELTVRLTDENEPFFIYMLSLCEEDFQRLKSEQGLLVDFLAFPQKFVHLLELCIKEEHGDTPKFVLNLSLSGRLGADGGTATLDVVETNPFKFLVHLSLKLSPAPDAFIKKFLAAAIKSLKEDNHRLETGLRNTQNDLQGRLQTCQQDLSTRNIDWDQKYRKMQTDMCALSERHRSELKEEQEKLMQIHRDAESRWILEKQELELKLSRESQQLEARNSFLETSNKELQERLQKAESSLREVRSHLVNVQTEHQDTLTRLQSANREVQVLTMQNQDHSKGNGNLRAQLAQMQQDIREREAKLAAAQELLNTTQQQKIHYEGLCEQRQAIISKKESALKTVSDELLKGNEIIRKLQSEIKNYHARLKQRNQIAYKQEEILTEKDDHLLKLQTDVSHYQDKLKECQEDNIKLSTELTEIKKKFEDSQKQIKSNENVISWLNKHLNDLQLGTARGGPPFYESSVMPMIRQPNHLTGMATSTPLCRPQVISPTSHPLYRPPVLPINTNFTPRLAYGTHQPTLNEPNRSPVLPLQSQLKSQTNSAAETANQQGSSENTQPKCISTDPETAKRPQSSDANKPKTKPRVTRQISSAPARK